MGILDDFTLGDDPLEPKKKEDPFKIDFDLGGYGKALTDSLIGSAGGDGGALPGNSADVPKAPAIEPVKPLKTDIEKPVMQPAISPVKIEPAKTYADIKAESQSRMDRAISALNTLVKPEQQQSEDVGTLGLTIAKEGSFNPGEMAQQANRIADAEREESANTGTLGIKFKKEGRFSPEALEDTLNQTGKADLQEAEQTARLARSVSQEARFDHDEIERIAGKIQQGYETGHEYRPNIAEPGYFLAKARSLKNRQEMGQTLTGLLNHYSDATYGAVSDQAQGMAGWNNARFDPSAINQYGAWERQQARDFVTASLEGGKQIKYDPEMAKMQAFPILDRFNRYYGYDAMGNTGFADASFSMDTLEEQLRDHMMNGTDLNYSHMEQAAKAMASLEKTGYGETVKNIMGSVYTGTATIGQETAHSLMTMLQGYPPAEVIAFDLQTNYLANGNDLAGWASEIEANRH